MRTILMIVVFAYVTGLPVQPKVDEQKLSELENGKLSKFILNFAKFSNLLERPLGK